MTCAVESNTGKSSPSLKQPFKFRIDLAIEGSLDTGLSPAAAPPRYVGHESSVLGRRAESKEDCGVTLQPGYEAEEPRQGIV